MAGEPLLVGFGTAPGRGLRPLDLEPAIAAAFDAGCRLFDTAEVYGTEPVLSRRLARAGIERQGVRLVSKLWQTNHAFDRALEACEGSLRRLRVERLDLYLVHAPEAWPYRGPIEIDPGWSSEEIASRVVPPMSAGVAEGAAAPSEVPLEETWEAMLELRRRGLVREVGVANFEIAQLKALAGYGDDRPAVVQVEIHPLRPRDELLAYCRERGIRMIAHSPFGGGAVLEERRLAEAAREAGRSPAQLVLRWHLERGVVPIPGSRRPEHVHENLAEVDFVLPASAAAVLDSLAETAACGTSGPARSAQAEATTASEGSHRWRASTSPKT